MGSVIPDPDDERANDPADADPPSATPSRTRVWSVSGLSVVGLGAIGARAPDAIGSIGALAVSVAPVPAPLQEGIGAAACEIGLGVLITALLWLAAVFLAYLAIGDLVSAFANKNSTKTNAQRESSEGFKNAATKMFGAVVIAGSPTILAGLGFTLLDCVDAVNIFGAVLVPLV